MSPTDYRQKAVLAIKWFALARTATQLISWVSTFVVIRLLDKSDYGLIAIAEVFTALVYLLTSSGIADSLIQHKNLTEHHRRSVLGLLILVNAAFTLIIWSVAPAIAEWYELPSLEALLRVMSLGFVMAPWISVSSAMLARELDFKQRAIVEMASSMVSVAVTITTAWLGFGYWAIAVGQLVHQGGRLLGFTLIMNSFVWPSFNFRGTSVLFKFGLLSTLASILWMCSNRIHALVGGHWYSVEALGLYAVAFQIACIPMIKILPVINEVVFPFYSRIQDEKDQLSQSVLLQIKFICVIIFPIVIGLAAVADVFVKAVLGEKWIEAIPLLQVLLLSIPFRTVIALYAPALRGVNRPHFAVYNLMVLLVALVPALILLKDRGVISLGFSWVIAAAIAFLFSTWLFAHAFRLNLGSIVAALMPGTLCSLIMWAALYLMREQWARLSPIMDLLLSVFLGGAVFLLTFVVLFKRDFRQLFRLIRPSKTVEAAP